MAIPTMRMGLVGFADEQHLRNLLATRNRNLQWERWPFMEADALWINGARTRLLRPGVVRVSSPDATKPAAVLNLNEIDRPVAFTLPLADDELQPPLAFDSHKVAEVAEVLNRFEAMLLDTAVDLTLAADIAAKRQELASPTYHLSMRGRLVGVLSVSGDIGLAQAIAPHELLNAEWAGRPAAGGQIPEHFRRTTISHVMWNYVMRHAEDSLLPSRYRKGIFHWRRMPAVPQRWVRQEHLMLISLLSTGAQTVASLTDATGLSEAAVVQHLAALYFGGSLTMDPRHAAPTRAIKPVTRDDHWPSSMTSTFSAPPVPAQKGRRTDVDLPTVPQPLEPTKKN